MSQLLSLDLSAFCSVRCDCVSSLSPTLCRSLTRIACRLFAIHSTTPVFTSVTHTRLQEGLEQQSNEHLHAALANAYVSTDQYQEAMEQYHSALSLNGNLLVASEGLDRLEKLMSGVDPGKDVANTSVRGMIRTLDSMRSCVLKYVNSFVCRRVGVTCRCGSNARIVLERVVMK